MPVKPFFEDSESPFFDARGRPARPGIFEFRRHDGMKIIYTLGFEEREAGEAPRLRVIRCSRMSEFPSPAHALNTLDGTWMRWLGPGEGSDPGEEDPEAGEPGSKSVTPDPGELL
jgi:hypothetical protein